MNASIHERVEGKRKQDAFFLFKEKSKKHLCND
jgi:hypothetical protein